MSMSGFIRLSRSAVNIGNLGVRQFRNIYTYKMTEKPTETAFTNGLESKTPFLIGVAGGTASGKNQLRKTPRARVANFTPDERALLSQLIKQKPIIESKLTDGKAIAKKQAAWNMITQEFNSNSNVHKRETVTLKRAWDNMKALKRKSHTTERGNLIRTGGGPYIPPPTPQHEAIITMVEESTVCQRIVEKLGQQHKEQTERRVVCISQDSFYRTLTPSERLRAERGQFNFDHPDAFDDKKLLATMKDILAGKKVEVPEYDYITNSISRRSHTIYPADVVLIEGILVFYFPEVRDLFHMKLFVDTDSDTRLARRVPRDIMERGRDLEQVLNQYMNFVKPAFEEFCLPTKKFADVIIPRGADNLVAIDLIVHHIWDIMYKKRPVKMVNGCNGHLEVEEGGGRRMSGSSEDTLSR